MFNNNFDINYGYISCAILLEDMNKIFEESDIIRRDEDDGELNMDTTTDKQQKKCKYAKELLRTISSCF